MSLFMGVVTRIIWPLNNFGKVENKYPKERVFSQNIDNSDNT
jgi:hypothetical protein